jgi:hypothetical protein
LPKGFVPSIGWGKAVRKILGVNVGFESFDNSAVYETQQILGWQTSLKSKLQKEPRRKYFIPTMV